MFFGASVSFVELYTKLVFSGRYWLVFLGIYHTETRDNLGRYLLVLCTYEKYIFTVSKKLLLRTNAMTLRYFLQ